MKLEFLFDLDGTLASYQQHIMQALKQYLPDNVNFDFVSEQKYPQYVWNVLSLIKNQPGFWEQLPIVPEGLELFNLCKMYGNIQVLTQGPINHPSAWMEKLKWVQNHLNPLVDYEVPVTITRDKSRFYGHILVEDYPDYIEAWLSKRPRGKVIIIDTPYNRSYKHDRCIRYRGVVDNSKIKAFLAREANIRANQ